MMTYYLQHNADHRNTTRPPTGDWCRKRGGIISGKKMFSKEHLIFVYIQKAGNDDEITGTRSAANAGWVITTNEPITSPPKKFIVSEMKEAV